MFKEITKEISVAKANEFFKLVKEIAKKKYNNNIDYENIKHVKIVYYFKFIDIKVLPDSDKAFISIFADDFSYSSVLEDDGILNYAKSYAEIPNIPLIFINGISIKEVNNEIIKIPLDALMARDDILHLLSDFTDVRYNNIIRDKAFWYSFTIGNSIENYEIDVSNGYVESCRVFGKFGSRHIIFKNKDNNKEFFGFIRCSFQKAENYMLAYKTVSRKKSVNIKELFNLLDMIKNSCEFIVMEKDECIELSFGPSITYTISLKNDKIILNSSEMDLELEFYSAVELLNFLWRKFIY